MNKLTLKDYLIIYLVILIIVSFIAGFFIGARAMKDEIKNYTNYTSSEELEKVYLKKEIEIFYNQIFWPAQSYILNVSEFLNDEKLINENDQKILINTGKEILANYEIYTFESPNLTNSVADLNLNINLLLEALNNNNIEKIKEAINHYLSGQKEFYLVIWIWEQSLNPGTRIAKESSTDWKTWSKGNLHQKNYIVSAILEKNSIKTFYRPEDITVHIDSYISKNENEMSISLEDVINLLIFSDSINEKDFLKYLNKYPTWYSSDILPEIPNFN